MSGAPSAAGSFAVWRLLVMAQLREQPGRLFITIFAIALGVALGAAVYLVNNTALTEFGSATKRLVGESDVVVRGPPAGFDESLYPMLARNPAVSAASPVLEFEAAVPGGRETLKILGVDPFKAAALQPELMAEIAGQIFDLFQPDGIFLSSSAAEVRHVTRGDTLQVLVGSTPKTLRILGILTAGSYSQVLGIMDIASAQQTFNQMGRLNRIDLRLADGIDVEDFRRDLGLHLPTGVLAVAPQVERDKAVTVTRAYRVNLNMLALVALWTGAFLVFSTQSLSVLRRRRSLALLRALGVTRGQLQRALVGEGAALGAFGSLLGVVMGVAIAAVVVRALSGDWGNGQLHTVGSSLRDIPLPALGFFFIGTLVAGAGAWVPARAASRQPPARSLKGGDDDQAMAAPRNSRRGFSLLVIGAALTQLPALGGLPVFGYAAVAALLFGAVLLVPALTVKVLQILPPTNRVVVDTAVAQLKGNVGLSTLSLASIIVSFSLMVAMAIMVFSFRVSFEHWLGKLLPADLQIRGPAGNDTAYFSSTDQVRMSAAEGVAHAEFRRTRQLLLDPAKQAVALIARNSSDAQVAADLPMIRTLRTALQPGTRRAWISEAMQDLYHLDVGDVLALPLNGKSVGFTVSGIWRDYARTGGAVVISRETYIALTGDGTATEGSVWLNGTRSATDVETALRACFPRSDSLDILTSQTLRQRSLQIFDRAFAITYALEAIAVVIGLTGVSFAASSTALARRAEFGVLRHIGMRKSEIVGILATEGVLMSGFGVAYGLILGVALSLVLVYVVNRQSFNWSIDLAIPLWQLGLLSATLVAAAAVTAVWGGRAATNQDAVRAVREDW